MAGMRAWAHRLFNEKKERRSNTTVAEPPPPPRDLTSFTEKHNEFALALYGQLREMPGNAFFSPLSIRTALTMVYAGARGDTAMQMSGALRLPPSGDALHEALAGLTHRLEAGDKPYEIAVANSLWGQDGAPVNTEFLELVDHHYGGGMNFVDFRRAADDARERINRWVEDKTRSRIRDLIPHGGVDDQTRLVLANAVYFLGSWERKFFAEATMRKPFYAGGSKKVQASLMHNCDEVGYFANDDLQALELDYRGGDLSMLVLLPTERKGLPALEKKLSAQLIHECVSGLRKCEVYIFLPKYRITWGSADIREQLRILGMPLAFDRQQADFSGINGYRAPHVDSLVVSNVFHQAFVEVNEEGTEAAAATGAVMTLGAAGGEERPSFQLFLADHPFLFAIRDRKTDLILFLGRVTDPTREN